MTQSPSLPELPKLPDYFEDFMDRTRQEVQAYATAHGLACYEAGSAAAAQAAWQPIATAPKDGTFVLIWRDHRGGEVLQARYAPTMFGDVCWGGVGWSLPKSSEPSHWMPLPAPPTQGAEGAAPQAGVREASEQRKHVGDSSFEGWFAENYRRLAITSKQAARETYAAGMNDENVLSELQANDSIISGQERRIAQLEADITAIEADILACSSSEAEIEAQRIAIDVYHRRGAMLGSEWSLLSSLIRLAASPAPSAAPQEADALREAPAVSYTEREMYEMQREGTLPDVQAWLTYCKGEPNVQPELRRRFGWCQFHTPVWMPLVFQRAALAQHQPATLGETK